MNSKDRVIAAINRQRPDRTPLDGYFRKDVWKKLENHFRTADAEEIMEALGLDIRYTTLEPSASFEDRAIPSPFPLLEIGAGRRDLVIPRENGWLEDECGICRAPNATGQHWLYTYHPLAEADLSAVRQYRLPEPASEERYRSVRSDVERWGDSHFTVVELWNIFKSAWELRGFERCLMDMHTEPQLMEVLADKILEHRIEQTKQLLRYDIDMLMIAGDVAMQDRMMLSPHMWRKYFKPRLKTWLEEIRREREIYVMFHSDGNLESIFDDLVEIGFDCIDPIQPECMDVVDIKRRFGSRVCLHGTISCQHTLPRGTVAEVEAEARERIHSCGRDGGLILSPSNTIQMDVPMENILALYDTAKNLSLE